VTSWRLWRACQTSRARCPRSRTRSAGQTTDRQRARRRLASAYHRVRRQTPISPRRRASLGLGPLGDVDGQHPGQRYTHRTTSIVRAWEIDPADRVTARNGARRATRPTIAATRSPRSNADAHPGPRRPPLAVNRRSSTADQKHKSANAGLRPAEICPGQQGGSSRAIAIVYLGARQARC